MNGRRFFMGVAALVACIGSAQAQGQAAAGASSPRGGAGNLGATLARQGAGSVTACSSCHGASGEGNAAAGFPRIAGQSQRYLDNQLQAYADGRRSNPVMQPIAKALNATQRRAVAQYYAGLGGTPPAAAAAPAPAASDAQRIDTGRTLASVGNETRQVQACANCHGPDGIGQWADYPYLAGQHAPYLLNALNEWKDGSRRSDPSGQMPLIAKNLTDEQVQAVVAYFASLPPPAPMDRRRAPLEASATAGARKVVSGPTAPAAAPQGLGTEQGGPVNGSNQSQGGTSNRTDGSGNGQGGNGQGGNGQGGGAPR